MQVKCLKGRSVPEFDYLIGAQDWSATLGTFSTGNTVDLGRGIGTNVESLMIVGGRSSIPAWLRLQERAIRNTSGRASFLMAGFRKRQVFEKNLRLILLMPAATWISIRDKNKNWDDRFHADVTAPPTGLTPAVLATMCDTYFARYDTGN